MSAIVVVGGGIGGLTASALLARADHRVTLLEAGPELGGKSRRIELGGQRIDTGPSLVTLPAVWEELLRRLGGEVAGVADLSLTRLPEVGRYFLDGEECALPVPAGHRWHAAWTRFAAMHAPLADDVTRLVLSDPLDRRSLPALGRLLQVYGSRLTTRSYLDGLDWMPDGLREIIAIHTLNAGVSPSRTAALYASMPAIMAETGAWVPQGGVHELVVALGRMAAAAGVDIRLSEPVIAIERGQVRSTVRTYAADVVVSGLDADRLAQLLQPGRRDPPRGIGRGIRRRALSCSAIAIYGSLRDALPEHVGAHSVVLPSRPAALHRSLEAGDEPAETMAFVSHYRAGEVYPNDRGTVGLLLTAPADGGRYGLDHPFVRREVERISRAIGLPRALTDYLEETEVLDPHYFGNSGEPHGALYGAARPVWMSGPFHQPGYIDARRPWLWRVGASVHPGGGIPAVLGGAMIAMARLEKRLERRR